MADNNIDIRRYLGEAAEPSSLGSRCRQETVRLGNLHGLYPRGDRMSLTSNLVDWRSAVNHP
jgi:hypothetical protein